MTYIGVGPVWYLISLLVSAAIVWVFLQKFPVTYGWSPAALTFMNIAGVLLIIGGVILHVSASIKMNIIKHIKNNELVTSGIFTYTRNPIYAAGIFILAGVLLFFHDPRMLLGALFSYVLLRIMIKGEEEALTTLFGDEYVAYKDKTNCVFPWFPKKKDPA